MPTPLRYSSTKVPDGGNAGITADFGAFGPGAPVPINFTGSTLDPGGFHPMRSQFTVGGWVRRKPGFAGLLFQANPYFWVSVNSLGQVEATFTYGSVLNSGDFKIDDGNWHYVGVSFAYPPNIIAGTMTLLVDGCEAGIQYNTVPSASSHVPPDCAIGGMNGFFEFASWSMWSDPVDAPLWGASGGESSLVAAWDFANGPATDASGRSPPIKVEQVWHVPCLAMGSNSSTAPDPADRLNPGGGPFTVAGWVFAPQPAPGTTYGLLTNQGGGFVLSVGLLFDQQKTPFVVCQFGGSGSPLKIQHRLDAPVQWIHLALAYDGELLVLYVNGSAVERSPGPFPVIQAPTISIGNTQAGAPWYLQCVSIWTQSLSQADIQACMDGDDPTGVTGCAAFFPLVADLGNTVTGSVLTPSGSVAIAECDLPLGAMPAAAAERAIARNAPDASPVGAPILQVRDYEALAEQAGIDIHAAPDAVSAAASAGALAWYEQFLKGLSPQEADSLRADFSRNLSIGRQLGQRGPVAGTHTVSADGNDLVVQRYADTGLQEVARVTLPTPLTPYQEWCAKIAFDVVSIVAAMLGIVATAAEIAGAISFEQALMEELGLVVRGAADADRERWALSSVWNVLKWFWKRKILFTLVRRLIRGSWLNLAFVVLSIVAQVVGWIAIPEVQLGAKIVAWAITIRQLVADLQDPPAPPPTA